MSVIIKGLEMPACCAHCPMCCDLDPNMQYCVALDDAPDIKDIWADRPEFCPLEEVEDAEHNPKSA